MIGPLADGHEHQTRDVVVIGAGVTGSIVARELARAGCDVLLVERKAFPRRKVCGCCLSARAIRGLETAGLADVVRDLHPIELDRLSLRAARRSVELPMPAGWAVSRSALDLTLLQAAESAGVEVWTEVAATVGECADDRRMVSLVWEDPAAPVVHSERVAARLVVAADGLGHPSTRHVIALSSNHPEGEVSAHSRLGGGCEVSQVPASFVGGAIHMLVGRDGYVGLTQLESGTWNVAAAFDRTAIKQRGGLGQTAANVVLEATGESFDFLIDADWSGTPLLTQAPAQVALERLFLAGDAAGYVEPFTGEGMAGAIESALVVSRLAINAVNDWRSEWIESWTGLHRRLIRQRAWLCRGLAQLLRRPWAVSASIDLLRHWPGLAAPLLRSLNASSDLLNVPAMALATHPDALTQRVTTTDVRTSARRSEGRIRCQ